MRISLRRYPSRSLPWSASAVKASDALDAQRLANCLHLRVGGVQACFPSLRGLLDDLGLRLGQAVQLVHELVGLPVRRADLALGRGLVVPRLRRGELPVEGEHWVDEEDYGVVAGSVPRSELPHCIGRVRLGNLGWRIEGVLTACADRERARTRGRDPWVGSGYLCRWRPAAWRPI